MSKPTAATSTSATPLAAIAACVEYHELGATLGGIAAAMEVLSVPLPPGEGHWFASVVRGVLVEAGVLEIEPPRPETYAEGHAEDAEDDEPVDWEQHNGLRYVPPRP